MYMNRHTGECRDDGFDYLMIAVIIFIGLVIGGIAMFGPEAAEGVMDLWLRVRA